MGGSRDCPQNALNGRTYYDNSPLSNVLPDQAKRIRSAASHIAGHRSVLPRSGLVEGGSEGVSRGDTASPHASVGQMLTLYASRLTAQTEKSPTL